ncbi:MAG: DNA-directed RNA polymerase subunit L [Nanoarchaeota archaeon]
MELEVHELSKNRIRFGLKSETHTFCNLLRKELWNDKSVTVAGYRIEHALESAPVFLIETDGKDVKKALSDAANRLNKLTDEANKKILKTLK